MKIKSAFNGIGSGAGVAWPLFGIVLAVLGGATGGTLALALGVISIALFIGITIGICYFSYQDMKNAQQKVKNQRHKLCAKILKDLDEYCPVYPFILDNSAGLSANKDIDSSADQAFYLFLNYILQCELQNKSLTEDDLVQFYKKNCSDTLKIPLTQLLVPVFFALVATFGSIAGCCAGMFGLFTGIGLFTSFTAFPVLGASIIIGALVMAIIMATKAAVETQSTFEHETINDLLKSTHKEFKKHASNNQAHFEKKSHRNLDKNPIHTSSLYSTATQTNPLDFDDNLGDPAQPALYSR